MRLLESFQCSQELTHGVQGSERVGAKGVFQAAKLDSARGPEPGRPTGPQGLARLDSQLLRSGAKVMGCCIIMGMVAEVTLGRPVTQMAVRPAVL